MGNAVKNEWDAFELVGRMRRPITECVLDHVAQVVSDKADSNARSSHHCWRRLGSENQKDRPLHVERYQSHDSRHLNHCRSHSK